MLPVSKTDVLTVSAVGIVDVFIAFDVVFGHRVILTKKVLCFLLLNVFVMQHFFFV